MSTELDPLLQWHQDEKAWWDMYGDYMTYQWRLTPSLHRAIRAPLEKEYVDYLLKPGCRLLDLGCGSGWLSFHFAEQGMSVLGIDVSKEQINAANELKAARDVGSVEFECADFMEWDSGRYAEYFDSVFVSAFMHHLPEIELELIVRKIASVVKPGGRVFLYEPLSAKRPRGLGAKLVDRLCAVALLLLLDKLPKWLGLASERHMAELARGYKMTSPHERPVDVDLLKTFCGDDFDIVEIKGWHLHSLGFSMQVTALKDGARRFYEPLGRLWYGVDRLLFSLFGWEAFSLPGRFILCGIKLVKKSNTSP
jgi:2-polyprenyl-3-methyl-5-hydroxy-6-metoxy-1,4-benzoquinol methylase